MIVDLFLASLKTLIVVTTGDIGMLNFLLSVCPEEYQYKIEYIYYEFHSDMIRYAKNKLRDFRIINYERDAEDVVQNVYMRAVLYIDRIDMSRSRKEIKSYVFSILENALNDFLRNEKSILDNTSSIDDYLYELSDDEFIESLGIKENYNIVVDNIKKLDCIYSTVMVFKFVEKMQVREIAELLGLPEKTVYTRLDRGRKQLKALMGEEKRYAGN